MAALLEHECPACGGSMHFDSRTQMVKCPYCGTCFKPESLKEKDADLAEDIPGAEPMGNQWQEGDNVCTYSCKSCGGEILCQATTAATSCPYCGSPVVMKERLAGSLCPDIVIPFKLDKKAAKAALQRHISDKVLLPRCFKSENHIEMIRGIYVPFWLYDVQIKADIEYQATEENEWDDDEYEYTETEYYRVRRAGTMAFRAVPVDGSSKMANELMESIEPYDLSQAKPFQTAYLTGFLADKYDVPAEVTKRRAQERIYNSVLKNMRSTVRGYDSVREKNTDVHMKVVRVRYALMPVWILNTRYKDKDYLFAMNGQTGKMVGDLPMSKVAYWTWFAAFTAVGAALAYLLGMLFG